MLDWSIGYRRAEPEPISDHVPLVGGFCSPLVSLSQLPSWRWARPMSLDNTVVHVPWEFEGNTYTYTEWAEYAVNWLALTHNTTRQSRVVLQVAERHNVIPRITPLYKSIRRLKSWALRLEKAFIPNIWDKVCRTIQAANLELPIT